MMKAIDPIGDLQTMSALQKEFCCPQCKGELRGNSPLVCHVCHAVYVVKDGIVDFRCQRKDYYFNPLSPKDMDALIEAMPGHSWPESVRTFLKHVNYNPGWLDNLVVEGRYAWKTLLNLNANTVLLDLGCGLGSLTCNIAPYVAQVYAMDLTYPRVMFTKNRLNKFNREENIRLLAGGDSRYLPFPDNRFDCVVLSGVLEWVGERGVFGTKNDSKALRAMKMIFSCLGKQSAQAMQLEFLQEIKRILKPQGQLFIAIENRLNYEYFRGRPDHHSGLKYASLLPRFLANLYSIAVNRAPYRTYTYSAYGYKRLLKQAGFARCDIFGLSPGYSHLERVFPIEADITKWRTSIPSGAKERLKRSKYFVPAYGLVATHSRSPQPSLQERLLDHLQSELPNPYRADSITIENYSVTSKDKGVMTGFIGKRSIVIKLPFTAAAIVEEEQNASTLRELTGVLSSRPSCIPRSILQGKFNNLHFFLEERVQGEPLNDLLFARGRTAFLGDMERVLEELNPAGAIALRKQPLIGNYYDDEVVRYLEVLFTVIPDNKIQVALTQLFFEELHGVNVAIGVMHGDLSVSNMFIEKDRISGLIDWGTSSLSALPLLDIYNYLDSVQRLYNPEDSVLQSVRLLARGQWPVSQEQEFLYHQYARLGMDEKAHVAFAHLYWLQHVAIGLRNYRLSFDAPGIKRDIEGVIEELLATKSGAD